MHGGTLKIVNCPVYVTKIEYVYLFPRRLT